MKFKPDPMKIEQIEDFVQHRCEHLGITQEVFAQLSRAYVEISQGYDELTFAEKTSDIGQKWLKGIKERGQYLGYIKV